MSDIPRLVLAAPASGQGKTTVAAALAVAAARRGRRVCVAEIDRKGAIPKLFGSAPLGYEPSSLAPGIWGINIELEQALFEYLELQLKMGRIARVVRGRHFVDFVTTAAPGLRDILVLGKIWYLEQGRSPRGPAQHFDTIIVDAQAAGHMLSFLAAPRGLADAVQVGPVRRQSDWLLEMLRDPRRTRVHMVTLAEEMSVQETRQTSEVLREDLRVCSGAVFANAIYPDLSLGRDALEGACHDGLLREFQLEARNAGIDLDADDVAGLLAYARFLEERRAIQAHHLRVLRRAIDEPIVQLPFMFCAGLDLADVEQLTNIIEDAIEAL